MRILQLTDFYSPTIGGLERHVETLSGELIRLGHEVAVATLQFGDRPEREVINGVQVYRLRGWSAALGRFHADPQRPFHPTVPDPSLTRQLRRLIAAEHPDVVHSHSWLQYSYFPLHRAKSGPAHVITLHDYGLGCVKKTNQHNGSDCTGPALAKCLRCAPEQYGWAKGAVLTTGLRASSLLHGKADGYVAISAAVADAARPVIPPDVPIHVVPSMVPNALAELADSVPRPDFLPPQDDYLLFVGTLGRHKGVEVLLEAHRRLRNRVPLVLIGTKHDVAPEADPLVTVVHNQPNPQVMAAWRRASVAVVPSVWAEPMGQVAVEAALAGRPVVASNTGGLRDVVLPEKTGLLVPPGDPAALAEAIDTLLADPARRAEMGAAGRDWARTFEVGAVGPRLITLFEQVLRDRRRASA